METTTPTSERLRVAWSAALADAGDQHGFYRRRLALPSPQFVFAGVLRPEGLRQVTFEVGVPPGPAVSAERTRGYKVEVDQPSPDRLLVHVAESDTPMPEPIFATLCADLVNAVEPCVSPAAAGQALVRRLLHWKLFFQHNPDGALSREKGVGLFAELDFMLTGLGAGFDPASLVTAWIGPLRRNQDFSFGTQAVEIKGTVANDLNVAKISNLRQLDDTGLDHLFLRHSAYDFREGNGTTLSAAVASIRQALSTDTAALLLFEDKLLAGGYAEPVTGEFASHGFTLRRHRHFRVTAGFPRLLESALPEGISEVTYILALTACLSFETTEAEVIENLNPSITP